MSGYRAQAWSRALSQSCIWLSAYGPPVSSDLTFTHMTGWLPMTDIIRLIRAAWLTDEPT